MTRALILLAASALALTACDLLAPGQPTSVSGTVLRDGVGVPGVTVRLLANLSGPPWCCRTAGTTTTDADGRYTVVEDEPRGGRECSIWGVGSARRSATGIRLHTDEPDVRIGGVECGEAQSGFNFEFLADLWYLGPDVGVDSISVALDQPFLISARFGVSRTFEPGSIHADSVLDWTWEGGLGATFEFDDALFRDQTDYTFDWYVNGMNFIDLISRGDVGSAPVVAHMGPVPLADTVQVTVRPTRWIDGEPTGVAVSPDGAFVFFVAQRRNVLKWFAVADGARGGQVELRSGMTVLTGSAPVDIAITPDGARAIVALSETANVSIIDIATQEKLRAPGVDAAPHGVAITPNGSFAYVTNRDDRTVSVLDLALDTVVAEPEVGLQPVDVAIDPAGAFAYVTELESQTVSVIDVATHSLDESIFLGGGPWGIAISPDGSVGYVAQTVTNELAVVDLVSRNVTTTIRVGDEPTNLAITPDGAFAGATEIATIEVGSKPFGIAITPDGTRAFVTNRASGSYSTIDLATNTVIG